MSRFSKYLDEIKEREKIGLSPKPIDSGELLKEIITHFRYKSKLSFSIS
ncbi:MAG: hypothetical protein CM15mP41_2340 [Flammeovirgaceae bacterium]|nr:MAG: hypothetical protein CM15mP41_2340 [Flammeovirgaceae bacterium]